MIYTLFSFLVWLVSAPFIFILSFKKKHKKSLLARFFLKNNPKFAPADIHFHACSLGEVAALEILAKNFKSRAFTTITATGFEKAKSFETNLRFLPFENFLPFWLEKSKVLVIFEAELWLNLVKTAKKNGSFVVLLNARISDKSYKNYKKFSFYYKKVFSYVDLVLAQSEVDRDRLKELGAKDIRVAGNLKSANFKSPSKIYPKFKEKFIVIASTHEKEEELILNAISPKKGEKFLIAPRHPERFEYVARVCESFAKKHSLKFEKFSENLGFNSDVILLDALNELLNFYAIADAVILGGSFVSGIGGHNPVEIAQFNTPIINGKFYHNQKTLFGLVDGVKFCEISELNEALKDENLSKTRIKSRYDLEKIVKILKDKI